MESPEDRFIEKSYMEGANSESTRTRMTKPVMVSVSKDKSGIDEVDIEVLVMRRALARIQRHAHLPQQQQRDKANTQENAPNNRTRNEESNTTTTTSINDHDVGGTARRHLNMNEYALGEQEEAHPTTTMTPLTTPTRVPPGSSKKNLKLHDPIIMGMSIQVDVDVINHSIDRLMKVLRSARVTSEEVQFQVKRLVSQAARGGGGGGGSPRLEAGGFTGRDAATANLSGVLPSPSKTTPQYFPLSPGTEGATPSVLQPPPLAGVAGTGAVRPIGTASSTTTSAAAVGGGGGPAALASPGGVKFQVSPSYQARKKENAVAAVKRNRASTEIEHLKKRAEKGLWGSLVRVLAQAEGDYKLVLNAEEVAARGLSLTAEAKIFGLASLGSALTTKRLPQVTIRGLQLPQDTEPYAQDRVLPPGCLHYLQSRDVPVIVNASSCWGNHSTSAIIDRTSLKPFMTKNIESSSIIVDFGGAVVRPSAYGFSSIHNILPGYFPRDWDLLGSMDGAKWTLIREHRGEKCFTGRVPSMVWEVDSGTDIELRQVDGSKTEKQKKKYNQPQDDMVVCRSMKIEITGANSFGTHELQVSAFEVYGSVMMVEEAEVPTLSSAGVIRKSEGGVKYIPTTGRATESGGGSGGAKSPLTIEERKLISVLDTNETVNARKKGFSALSSCPDISTLIKKRGGGKK